MTNMRHCQSDNARETLPEGKSVQGNIKTLELINDITDTLFT